MFLRFRGDHRRDLEALPLGVHARDIRFEDAPDPRHGRALLVHEEERPLESLQLDRARKRRLEHIAPKLTELVLVIPRVRLTVFIS